MLQLFLGQIPEAIFFALFMIYAKGIKQKRTLFTILIILEYLLLLNLFKYNWFFHIGFMIMTFLTLKVLYKEKSQITDIFILLIGYIFMIITSVICFFISNNNVIIATILNRIMIFSFIFIFRNKLIKLQKIYKSLWNRNDNIHKKIKTTTFRSINIVVFNILFWLLNALMLYAIYYNSL